tara:strand:+ start:466 stop:735 length:270 start_codon:yes stop_codon:yes gene_type:complete
MEKIKVTIRYWLCNDIGWDECEDYYNKHYKDIGGGGVVGYDDGIISYDTIANVMIREGDRIGTKIGYGIVNWISYDIESNHLTIVFEEE